MYLWHFTQQPPPVIFAPSAASYLHFASQLQVSRQSFFTILFTWLAPVTSTYVLLRHVSLFRFVVRLRFVFFAFLELVCVRVSFDVIWVCWVMYFLLVVLSLLIIISAVDCLVKLVSKVTFFLSFFFGVAHAPFACQHWGLPHTTCS